MLQERVLSGTMGSQVADTTVDGKAGATVTLGCKVEVVLGERVPSGRMGSEVVDAMVGG